MQKTRLKKSLSCTLCAVLIAAMALFAAGCKDNATGTGPAVSGSAASQSDVSVLGEGSKVFAFTVTDGEGGVTSWEIHTDCTTVGDALMGLGLIDGDEGEYGLYVRTVNGMTFEYETDGKYWAFYIDGEYAMTGVDETDIVEGATYSFVVE